MKAYVMGYIIQDMEKFVIIMLIWRYAISATSSKVWGARIQNENLPKMIFNA